MKKPDLSRLSPIAGRYQVIRELGRGGAGLTYLVKDRKREGALLALKTLRLDEASDEVKAGFLKESQILHELNHPHLARVFDFGEADPYLFYSSEFVEGTDFQKACRDRDWNAIFDLVVQGAGALDYLRRKGVIHRDIKPENILVGKVHHPDRTDQKERLFLKIIDFGVAKTQQGANRPTPVGGTLAYMAPEVLARRPYDHRVDLYAFGVVLYGMALGRLPFAKEKNFAKYLDALKNRAIDLQPLEASDEIPDGIIEVIRRLVVRNPEDRLSDPLEIIKIINELEHENFSLEPVSSSVIGMEPLTTPTTPEAQDSMAAFSDKSGPEILEHLLQLIRSGRAKEAWGFAEALLPRIQKEKDFSTVERFYGAAGYILVSQGRFAEVEDWLKQMGSHPVLKGKPSIERTLLEIDALCRKGHLSQAEALIRNFDLEILSRADLAQNTRWENLNALLARAQGNFLQAAEHFETGADLAKRSGRRDHQLSALMNAGSLFFEQGQWKKAYYLFREAEPLARELGHFSLLGALLNNLGNLYLYFGRMRDGDQAFLESLRLAEQEGLKPLAVSNLFMLTLNQEARGNWELVQGYLDRALELARDLEESASRLQVVLARGYYHLWRNEFSECEQAIQELRDKAQKSELESFRERADWLEAKLRIRQQEVAPFPVEDWLRENLQAAEKKTSKNNLWQIFSDLGEWAHLAGKPALAKDYFRRALHVIEELQAEIPDEFKKSFLRDRKKEKIRKAYEKIPLPESTVTGEPTPKAPVTMRNKPEEPQSEKVSPFFTRRSIMETRNETPSAGQVSDPTHVSFKNWTEITRRILSQQNLDKLLEEILDAAIQLTDAERGFIIHSESQDLDIRAARNMEKETLDREEEKFSMTIAREVMRSGKSSVILDALKEDRFANAQSVQALNIRSVLCVPLSIGLRAVGLIYLDNRFRRGVFLEEHIPLLEALADQASLALEHARLHQENKAKIKELQDSRDTIKQLSSRLEEELKITTVDLQALRETMKRQHEEMALRFTYDKIIGKSEALQKVLKMLDRVVDSNVNVFIYGESGTGKELIAQAIHFNSSRKDYPFVSENCGAFPENLLESELFGHVRGAFTGADKNKLGLFHMANRGTIFLDEVGEMPIAMQAKLLRVLQEGEVRQVGGKEYQKVDVRVVSASNKDLEKMMQAGEFRPDLYFRLNVVRINLPSLRERVEDIPLLAEHFLDMAAKAEGQPKPRLLKSALKLLMEYSWPGNIRELKNEIQKMVVLGAKQIGPENLSPHILESSLQFGGEEERGGLEGMLAEIEKKAILQNLKKFRGNKVKVAQALKIGRKTLYTKMDLYEIDKQYGKNL